MKRIQELRTAFPEVDDGFDHAVITALENVEEQKAVPRRRALRLAIAAAVMMLAATAGIAVTLEHWGIADFIANHHSRTMNMNSVEQADLPPFEPVSLDTQYAHMTVTEAVYDGYGVYVVVEAEARREKTMLVGQVFGYDEPAHIAVYGAPRDMTITEYTQSIGYDWVVSAVLDFDTTTAHYYSSKTNEDGTVSFMIWAYVKNEFRDQPELKITLESYLLGPTTQYSLEKEITLQRAGERQSVRSIPGETATYEQIGVTVTGVELIRTPITTYAIISWDAVDEKADSLRAAGYRMLRIEDDQGNALLDGANPIYTRFVSALLPPGVEPYDLSTLYLEAFPEAVTLVENAAVKDAAQRHTFQLQ